MTLRLGPRFFASALCSFSLLGSLSLTACGGARPSYDDGSAKDPDASTDDSDASTPDESQPLVAIDVSKRLQTLEGFGASVAWYGNSYVAHPNRDALKSILFAELGLDILRLRNQFRNVSGNPDPAGFTLYEDAESSLGHSPRILLTSWSPPASLKANAVLDCENADPTCTLKKDDSGQYVYEAFGEYWADSLEEYRRLGLDPYYISIQNEPDYIPTNDGGWEACRFDATESENYPGYDRAFAAVIDSLDARGLTARLLGPETAQVAGARVERYVAALDDSKLYGVAHHLYGGGQWANPPSYDGAFSGIAENLSKFPRFQTEFSPSGDGQDGNDAGFEVAWLIHESLAVEGASAYLHWELFWPTSGLVTIENPDEPAQWSNADGYVVNPAYYAMRHYSKYTAPGDRFVETKSNRALVLATSVLRSDERTLTIILLNRSRDPQEFTLDLGDFEPQNSLRLETTEAAKWQTKDPLTGAKSVLTLPSRSVTTVVATLDDTLPTGT